MRNYFPKRPSGAPLLTLSKLYDVPVGFVPPSYFEAEYCLFCGRRRVAVARYRMICLVLICISVSIHSLFSHDVPLHFNAHAYKYTCFRCARNLYYANRFCRVLPRSKCYSSKTCLMCIICTLGNTRCSNGTMNNTSTLIL